MSCCLVVALAGLSACSFPPPKPLSDGSCPGRVANERDDTEILVEIYRDRVEPKNFFTAFEVAPRSSRRVSVPPGKFIVRITDTNGKYTRDHEILVAIKGSSLFTFKSPEAGINEPEVVYWWVKRLKDPDDRKI